MTDQNALTPVEPAGALAPHAELKPAGRYTGRKSKQFKEICRDIGKGSKYNLDDEIEVIRGFLGTLVELMAADDEKLETYGLFKVLTDGGYDRKDAYAVIRKVETQLDAKSVAVISKEIRETLQTAAEMEGMIQVARVRTFMAAVSRIVRDEVKDDKAHERILRRVTGLPL